MPAPPSLEDRETQKAAIGQNDTCEIHSDIAPVYTQSARCFIGTTRMDQQDWLCILWSMEFRCFTKHFRYSSDPLKANSSYLNAVGLRMQ